MYIAWGQVSWSGIDTRRHWRWTEGSTAHNPATVVIKISSFLAMSPFPTTSTTSDPSEINTQLSRLSNISGHMAGSAPSVFTADRVPQAPEDPLFGLMTAYRNDTFEKKVDLGIGAYRDNNAKPWVLPVVKKVCGLHWGPCHESYSAYGKPRQMKSCGMTPTLIMNIFPSPVLQSSPPPLRHSCLEPIAQQSQRKGYVTNSLHSS